MVRLPLIIHNDCSFISLCLLWVKLITIYVLTGNYYYETIDMSGDCCCAWGSNHLKSLDPFTAQKQSAFTNSLPAVVSLASYILDISTDSVAGKDIGDQFSSLFHVCMLL